MAWRTEDDNKSAASPSSLDLKIQAAMNPAFGSEIFASLPGKPEIIEKASISIEALQAQKTLPLPAGGEDFYAATPLKFLLLEKTAAFLGLPAPLPPDTNTKADRDERPRPTLASLDPAPRSVLEELDQYGARHAAASSTLPVRDPARLAQDYMENAALSWSRDTLNTIAESLFSRLSDHGRVRFNFGFDQHGNLLGEGDLFLPLYETPRTTMFTQIGARRIDADEDAGKDRWIGNFGLGQRWFPAAKDEEDAGDWMIGYNAFFDKDFTRSHRRGGVGVEVQYDWLRLTSNRYFPLSGWKDSYDFDRRLVEERPAGGWDARVKAYLPAYRNLALTGSYTQWYGDHVGMFGHRALEKDPRVWSYGIEYTPIPLVSGFLVQRSTGRGKKETEFGINFTWHFDLPWVKQISPSKVTEMRTVSNSRHEFVDRENRVILEYRSNIAAENCGDFTSAPFYCTVSLIAEFMDTSGNPMRNALVTWRVIKAQNNSKATMTGWENRKTGLTWGKEPEPNLTYEQLAEERIASATHNTSITNSFGQAVMQLTDIVGERMVTVEAKATIGGKEYAVTQSVSFGKGPLSVFRDKPLEKADDTNSWTKAAGKCGSVNDTSVGYHSETKLPTKAQLQAVSVSGNGGQGAAAAVGWRNDNGNNSSPSTDRFRYWTGEISRIDGTYGPIAGVVLLYNGSLADEYGISHGNPVGVCLR
jgi:hypothetical protein